jgi:quinol-cytochrome oxidoreductase complex cytochrome b subunit
VPLPGGTPRPDRQGVLMTAVGNWLRERIPVDGDKLRELTNEPVPNHLKRWWFCLGGTPAYLFVVQVVTGIMLAFYYSPGTTQAYESVRYITEEAAYGWFLRGMHRWGATLMIAAIILHQMRVYFTGAYRKPRELNWMVGMTLLVCTLAIGFTGYSLVYEQLSYWGATVAANLTDAVPLVGPFLKKLLLAGDTYNAQTLPRFFILHAAVLPVVMIALLFVHITLIRLQGVTEFRFKADERAPSKTFSFFPDHFLTELSLGLVLMILLSVLATVFPATMGPRADPLTTPEVIKPEWYFYVAFRWLKLFSLTFAVLTTGLIVFLMFAWPFVDAWFRRRNPHSEASVWIGIGGVFVILALTVWEAVVAH